MKSYFVFPKIFLVFLNLSRRAEVCRGLTPDMFLKIIGLFLVVSSVVHCEIQLPNTTKPLSYYLSLTTYIHEEDYSFFGFVDINIRALETTDTVTLHAENLDDLEVTLRDKNSSPAKVYHNLTFSEDKENDFLRIEMPDNVVLQEGHDYTISVSFLGEMANSSYGFYKLNFMDSQNRRVYADDLWLIYGYFLN